MWHSRSPLYTTQPVQSTLYLHWPRSGNQNVKWIDNNHHYNNHRFNSHYISQSAAWPAELENFVGAKFYCLHALANGKQRIWIREKMLEFSSTVLSTLSP